MPYIVAGLAVTFVLLSVVYLAHQAPTISCDDPAGFSDAEIAEMDVVRDQEEAQKTARLRDNIKGDTFAVVTMATSLILGSHSLLKVQPKLSVSAAASYRSTCRTAPDCVRFGRRIPNQQAFHTVPFGA
jgi:ABC-type uncharacterized transport system permease subunit